MNKLQKSSLPKNFVAKKTSLLWRRGIWRGCRIDAGHVQSPWRLILDVRADRRPTSSMPGFTLLMAVIFVVACAILGTLYVLFRHAHRSPAAKPRRKFLLSNWK
jgi:hypothetical protein